MVKSEEGTFSTRDGVHLYTKTWIPGDPSSLSLIFIHGFSDHINAYYDLFPTLASPPYNITVYGFDQRGWGRSAAKRSEWGLTGDTHQVLSDMNDFICHVSSTLSKDGTAVKLFLMGHSMGGAESLMYVLSDIKSLSPAQTISLPLSGVLVESPFVAFPPASQPNALTVWAGRIAAKVLPNMQKVQKLNPSFMCRDPKVCKDWETDSLCHDTGTLLGLAGLLDRATYLNGIGTGTVKVQSGMHDKLQCPIWWGHGTADHVCDFTASRRLYDKFITGSKQDESIQKSKFITYEGGYHKLHAEPDGMKEQFAKDVGEWILQIGGTGTEEKASRTSGVGAAGPISAEVDDKNNVDENVKSKL